MLTSPLISAEELLTILDDPHVGIVDCRFSLDEPQRGRTAWSEACIPGARYAHLDDDLSAPTGDGTAGRHPLPKPASIAALRRRWGCDADTFIVCFDDAGGPFAARLWWMLQWIGHERVSVLDGGWQAWERIEGPVAPGTLRPRSKESQPYSAKARAATRSNMRATAEDILQGRGVPVDARAHERFLGQVEPIDTVAGHIPGAASMPWMGNLDEMGHFLAPAALAERWSKVADAENAICYCGSGVTACHNVLAAVVAGLPMPKLYPPSWSGWITDVDRPVTSGEE